MSKTALPDSDVELLTKNLPWKLDLQAIGKAGSHLVMCMAVQ